MSDESNLFYSHTAVAVESNSNNGYVCKPIWICVFFVYECRSVDGDMIPGSVINDVWILLQETAEFTRNGSCNVFCLIVVVI